MADGIAVVIPAWNLGDVLRQAVTSVMSQEIEVRLIVVDNASEEPLPPLPEAEVIRLPERVSVGQARNVGLAHVVDEEFVMFMEGDDVLLPGALEFLHRIIAGRAEVVIVAGSFLVWNPDSGTRVSANWPFDYCYRLSRYPRCFALVNCLRNVMPTTGPALMRADAARAAGGFGDSNWAEDWALGAVLAFCGVPVLKREVCGLYRVDADRTTLSDLKEQRRLRPSWEGRRYVRRKLMKTSVIPWYVRLASPLLAPIHAYFVMSDLRKGRQRADN